jgi:hypothetical protein
VLPDSTPLSTVFRTDDVKPRQLARTQQGVGERPTTTLQRF